MDRSLDKVIDQPLLQWLPLPSTQIGLSDVAQLYLYDTSSFELDWKMMRHIPWRFFYIDYLHLQQDVGNLTFGTLNRRLETEWTKAHDFFILKKGEIERRLASCVPKDNKTILIIMNEIHQLHRFTRLNYIAFLRLIIEFDKLGATINSDTFRRIMMNKPFWDDTNVLYEFLNCINFLSVSPIDSSPKLKYHQENSISINLSKQTFFSAVENFSTSLTTSTPQVFSPVFVNTNPISFYPQHHHGTNTSKHDIKKEPELMLYPKIPSFHHPLSPTASISTLGSCETASSSMGNTAISDVPMASRSIRKYWVHPDHIMEVMLYLSHHAVLQNKEGNPSSTYPAVSEVGHPLGIKSKLAAMNPLGLHRQIVANPSQIDSTTKTQVKITTLHMDTHDLKSYAERIVGQPLNNDASNNNECFITRARWYETNDNSNDSAPFVALEQKAYHRHSTHRKQSMGHKGLGKIPQYSQNNSNNALHSSYWVQQRLWLKSKRLDSWIQSKYSCKNILSKSSCQYRTNELLIEDPQHKESISHGLMKMEKEVHGKDKLPMLKTTQNRMVYGTSDNKIFITVDTDIAMMKCTSDETFSEKLNSNDDDSMSIEPTLGHRTSGLFTTNDKRFPYNNMASNDIVRFPYCVVQVSEETTPGTPTSSDLDRYCDTQWIEDLCDSPLLEPVHDFSTYLHGVATLLSEKVHVFPSWISKVETMDIRRSRHGTLLTERKRSHERGNSNDQSVSSITTQSSFSKSEFNSPWSSTTIATLVTYCDDDLEDEGDENRSPNEANHLSPPAVNEHRRSFDSYCSFDHPTSSKSDPTNCRSCVGKKRDIHYDPSASKLLSVVRTLWPNRFIPEREPLFQHGNSMNYHATSNDDLESGYSNYKSDSKKVPRTTLLTTLCIMVSLGASLLFYTFVINI